MARVVSTNLWGNWMLVRSVIVTATMIGLVTRLRNVPGNLKMSVRYEAVIAL